MKNLLKYSILVLLTFNNLFSNGQISQKKRIEIELGEDYQKSSSLFIWGKWIGASF